MQIPVSIKKIEGSCWMAYPETEINYYPATCTVDEVIRKYLEDHPYLGSQDIIFQITPEEVAR